MRQKLQPFHGFLEGTGPAFRIVQRGGVMVQAHPEGELAVIARDKVCHKFAHAGAQ